jgi:peptide/nickel transport system permease protein
MSTDTDAGREADATRFDQVDWEAYAGGRTTRPSINTILFALTATPILALAVYDWVAVGQRETALGALAAATNLERVFATLGLDFGIAAVDYAFAVTLLLFVWYLLFPLYHHPRITRYYWRRFRRNRPALVSLAWLLVVFGGGLLGPLVLSAPEQNVLAGHQPPVGMTVAETNVAQCVGEVTNGRCAGTWEYPLGTTRGGKGVFTGVVYGMTISMKIAFITTTIVAGVGITVGTVSAYAGGWVDEVAMRAVDIVLSFPTLLFFLLVLYVYGAGLGMFIVVFSAFGWGGTARYVRSKALSVSEEEFVKAGRLSGASTRRIVRRHVVPNTASSIITQLTLLIPGFLLAEAQLAFLGLGDSSIASWGQLIAAGRSDLAFAPWIVLAPGIVLFLTILAFNFLGDALLDAVDPEATTEADR